MKNFDNFIKYGLSMSRLRKSEIEILREWRNNPEVAKEMKIQNGKQITKEEQEAWFNSIKDDVNMLYYIIYNNKKAIGYASLKNIDWQAKEGMSGLLLNPNLSRNSADLEAKHKWIYLAYDFFFEILEINKINIEVHKNNIKALLVNNNIGFKKKFECNDGNFLTFSLRKDEYLSKRDEVLGENIK